MYLEKVLPQYYVFHHQSHVDWPGINPVPPRSDACEQPPKKCLSPATLLSLHISRNHLCNNLPTGLPIRIVYDQNPLRSNHTPKHMHLDFRIHKDFHENDRVLYAIAPQPHLLPRQRNSFISRFRQHIRVCP